MKAPPAKKAPCRWVRLAENIFRRGDGRDLWLRYRRIGRAPVEERIGPVSISEARKILAERRTKEGRLLSGLEPAPRSRDGGDVDHPTFFCPDIFCVDGPLRKS